LSNKYEISYFLNIGFIYDFMINTIQKGYKNFKEPTPLKWKVIGMIIAITCAGMTPAVMGLPVDDNMKAWLNCGFAFLMVISNVITNLFTEKNAEHQ